MNESTHIQRKVFPNLDGYYQIMEYENKNISNINKMLNIQNIAVNEVLHDVVMYKKKIYILRFSLAIRDKNLKKIGFVVAVIPIFSGGKFLDKELANKFRNLVKIKKITIENTKGSEFSIVLDDTHYLNCDLDFNNGFYLVFICLIISIFILLILHIVLFIENFKKISRLLIGEVLSQNNKTETIHLFLKGIVESYFFGIDSIIFFEYRDRKLCCCACYHTKRNFFKILQEKMLNRIFTLNEDAQKLLNEYKNTGIRVIQADKLSSIFSEDIDTRIPTGKSADFQISYNQSNDNSRYIILYTGNSTRDKILRDYYILLETKLIALHKNNFFSSNEKLFHAMHRRTEDIRRNIITQALDENIKERINNVLGDVHKSIDKEKCSFSHELEILCLEDFLEKIQSYTKAEYPKLKFSTSIISSELYKIECNVAQVKQVFSNLLSNAQEARDRDNRDTLDIEIKAETSNGEKVYSASEYIKILFIDNGKEIPLERKSSIFDKGETAKASAINHGLGLWITKNILEEHRGYIYENGEKNVRFNVLLPIWRKINEIEADINYRG